jgi:hypothetical protein
MKRRGAVRNHFSARYTLPNPKKSELITFSPKDKIIVVAEN